VLPSGHCRAADVGLIRKKSVHTSAQQTLHLGLHITVLSRIIAALQSRRHKKILGAQCPRHYLQTRCMCIGY